jgi:hypothetical protein
MFLNSSGKRILSKLLRLLAGHCIGMGGLGIWWLFRVFKRRGFLLPATKVQKKDFAVYGIVGICWRTLWESEMARR